MGNVKVRYYVTRQHPGRPKWGYWAPCLARRNKTTGKIEPTLMAKLGFELIDCGEDGPRAWAIAERWNERWDAAFAEHRTKQTSKPAERVFPPGSLGDGFARFRKTHSWTDDKKPRTKEDWWRGWDHIEPVFGDVAPATVSFEDLDGWYAALLKAVGVREAHRAMKIWRAMWVVVGALRDARGKPYCEAAKDPSLAIRRKTPKARNAIWYEGEAVRLVKGAVRMRFHGLAAALAVAWDTMLSPVDVRGLSTSQLKQQGAGELFTVDRAKTGKSAIGTLSRRASRVLKTYIASLPFELHPALPIFHTRGAAPGPRGGKPRAPVPYTKDTLGDDFRVVRNALFPGDTRKLSDFRRSGAVEVTAGEGTDAALAGKMANSIDQNKELQATYRPGVTAVVRLADEARRRGRGRMRGGEK